MGRRARVDSDLDELGPDESLPDPWELDRSRPQPEVYSRPLPEDAFDPDAIKVIRRLRRHGHVAYLVGGGVRDLLLGKRPKDFDVATSARPHEVRALFRNCRIIGRRFRLAHILFGPNKVIETATFRRDPSLPFEELEPSEAADDQRLRRRSRDDGDLLIRHDNVFGEPHEDAIRRDFTINGLFYDIDRGRVIDYIGGMPDLERRIVRTIGDPDVRFREDPIRILRAIKFSARLDLGIDPEVYDAMVEHRGDIARAAKPRIFEELLRLLRGGAAQRSIFLLWDTGALAVMLPELASYLDDDAPDADLTWARLAQVDRRVRDERLPPDTLLLAALLRGVIEEAVEGTSDREAAFEDFMEPIGARLNVPRRIREKLRFLLANPRRTSSRRAAPLGLGKREPAAEATLLSALEREARGHVSLVEPDEEAADDLADEPRRKRRRRRRR